MAKKKTKSKKNKSNDKPKASASKKKKVSKSKAKSGKKKANKHAAKPIVVTQDQIAKRAFELWMDRGQPAGQDQIIWHDAERELLGS
jgi:hypothetical protein